MNKIAKKIAAGLLAVSVATTGLTFDIQKAEAFNLGKIGKDIGKSLENVGKGIGGAVGGAVGGVLGGGKNGGQVDVQGLRKSETLLLANLAVSAGLMNSALEQCKMATGQSAANAHLMQTNAVVRNLNKNDMGAAVNMKNAADKAKKDKVDVAIKNNLSAAITSGDEAKLKRIDSYIKNANQQRMISDALGAIAVVQAGKIISDTIKGGLSVNNAGNIVKFAKTAKEAQSLLSARSKLSKMLSTATAEYKKTRGIKDPTKAEIDKTAKTMSANE